MSDRGCRQKERGIDGGPHKIG